MANDSKTHSELPPQALQPPSDLIPVVIGTAGHIDHGKTSLVRELTGINTDRLPEEIKRGISIDLGFAHWKTPEFHFGIVDVPGHDRFIKNMVAGATGIDLALLVVAADDGVMPQTREHLEILDLLGVRAGVIALTKVDLVEPDYVDLAEAEVRELVADTFLENCQFVRISSTTRQGFDQLRSALIHAARSCPCAVPKSVFRMPIDNIFSKAGQGTIVTGTVLSGTVRREDIVELMPIGTSFRVRGVQQQKQGAEQSSAHRRTGVNLANVKCDEIHRGFELATSGYLKPTQRLLVSLRALPSSPLELRDRMTFALHLGTTEVNTRLVLKGRRLAPGESGVAELRVSRPIVAEFGQRFIIRLPSPAITVGGGQILDPNLEPRIRIKSLEEYAEPRQSTDPVTRLSGLLSRMRQMDLSPLQIACRIGVNPEQVPGLFATLQQQSLVNNLGTAQSPHWIHQVSWNAVLETARRQIRKLMAEQQPRRTVPIATITNALRPILAEFLLGPIQTELIQSGWLVGTGGNYGPAELQIRLSKRQQELRSNLLNKISEGGTAPPLLKELSLILQQPIEKLEPLLQLDVDEGKLAKLTDGVYYSLIALELIRKQTAGVFAATPSATVAQLRDAWGLSRKHSIPLVEWLDARHITIRQGDLRIAGPSIHAEFISH